MAQRDDTTIGFTYVNEKKLADVVRLSYIESKIVIIKWSYSVNTPPPERASCSRGARCVVFAVAGFLLVLACAMQATAQKPRLKLLDYGKWGDSIGIQCVPGPLYIDDTLEVKPGTLVDNGEIYSTDSWYMSHASTVADVDRFRERKVDTIDVGSWEFFDDSVRSRLQDAMGKLGRFRLVSRGSMRFFRDPRLYYQVIFDEPVKYAVAEATFKNQGIYKYPQFAFEGIGACIIPTAVSVNSDSLSSAPSRPTAVSHGNIQVTGFHGPYTLYDISGRIVTHGELFQVDENRVLQVNPGAYFLQSATSVKTFMVLP